MNEIKKEVEDVLMKTIVKTNSNTQSLPPSLPPIPNTLIQNSGQPSPSGNKEGVPKKETLIIQEHEQIRSILPSSFSDITTSNNPPAPSQQPTQSNISPTSPKQSTVPRSKSSPLP